MGIVITKNGLYKDKHGRAVKIVKNHDNKWEKKGSDGMEIYTSQGTMYWWSIDSERYFMSTDLKTDITKRLSSWLKGPNFL